jgi:diguanylate cyclase (GGDEF)-like protein
VITQTEAPARLFDILAVEDSPTQGEALKHDLEQQAYAVRLARDGRHALTLLNDHPPALVISDINMPGMNGYELCERIKADEGTQRIPVILLTSLVEIEEIFQALACGADSFIAKPYQADNLLAHVQHLLTIAPRRAGKAVEVEITLGGSRRLVTADPQQMISLLVSVFETILRRNFDLAQSHEAMRSLNEHLEELVADRTAVLSAEIAARELLQVELRALSLSDALTGLHNRRGLMTLAELYYRLAARTQKAFALLMIDVNHFKRINDAYGHAEGDNALISIAQLLRRTFRDSDILARFGGDEFVILLTDCQADTARLAVHRLNETLDRMNADAVGRYSLSLSLGLALFNPNDPTSLQALLEQADCAMYTEKRRAADSRER